MKKVLAYDIGGTNTRVALVNEKYEIEKQLIYPTIRDSKEAFLANVKKVTDDLGINMDEVCAIGAGVPGVVNRETAYIYDLPNVHIKDIPFGEFMEKEYGKKVFLRNDAEVACLAEANIGEHSKYERVFFITISTGLGGALAVDGINQDYITEIGHTAYKYHGVMEEYEALASGTGMVKLCALNDLKVKNAAEFFKLVKAKNEKALYVYKEWLAILSDFITMVQDSYEPDVICVTGGVMKEKDLFFEDLKSLNPNSNIVVCHHSEYAGIMGASVYAFSMLEK